MNLTEFEQLAQSHGFTLARSISISGLSSDAEAETTFVDIFRDVTDAFGEYVFSSFGDQTIDGTFLDGLLECYRINTPSSALWQYIESERERGRGVTPQEATAIYARLEHIHRMFWDLICDTYLSITPVRIFQS